MTGQESWYTCHVRPRRLDACAATVAEFGPSSTTWYELVRPPGTPGFAVAPDSVMPTSYADFAFNSTTIVDLQGAWLRICI